MIRDRILERLGVPTEPELVDRASRWERAKRDVWLFASTIISIAIVFVPATVAMATTGFHASVGVATTISAALIVATMLVDVFWVFPWGVERFDVVPPWQFREEEVRES